MVATVRGSRVCKHHWSSPFAPVEGYRAASLLNAEITAEEILAGGIREADWSFPVVASTQITDRTGDVVRAEGCDASGLATNPVVFWDHQSVELPIGTLRSPQDGRFYFAVEPGRGVLARIWIYKPADDDHTPHADFCRTVWALVKAGFVNALSVGFDPKGSVKGTREGGSYYAEWEALEISLTGIGMNKEALVIRDPARLPASFFKSLHPTIRKSLSSWYPQEKAFMSSSTAATTVAKGEHHNTHDIKFRDGKWVILDNRTRKVLSTHASRAEATAALRALEFHKHEGKGHAATTRKGMSEADGASGGYAVPEDDGGDSQGEQTKSLRETCKCLGERMKDHDTDGHSLHFNPKTGELHHSYPDSADEEAVKSMHADLSDVPGVKSVTGEPESGPQGEDFHKVYPREKDMDGGDMTTERHRGGVEKRARRMARIGKATYRMVRKRKLNGWIGKALEWTARRVMPTLLKAEMPEDKAVAVAWGIAAARKGLLPLVAKSMGDGDPDDDGDDDTTADPAVNPDAAEDAAAGNTPDAAEDMADDAATDAAMDVPDDEDTGGPDGLELVQTAIENLEAALPRLEPERRAFWSNIIDQIREHGEETYPDEDFGGEDTAGEEAAAEGANDDADEQKVTDEMLARYKGLRPRRIKRVSIARKLKSLSHRDPATAEIIRKAANHLHEIGDMAMDHDEKRGGCALKGYTPAHHRAARLRARELDRLHGAITKAGDPKEEEKPREGQRPTDESLDFDAIEHRLKSAEAAVGHFITTANELGARAGVRRRY